VLVARKPRKVSEGAVRHDSDVTNTVATYHAALISVHFPQNPLKLPEFQLPRKCPSFRKRGRQNSIAPNALSRLAARALRCRRCAHGLATLANCRTASCLPASLKLMACHARQGWPETATN
jgi:hypothetical protein